MTTAVESGGRYQNACILGAGRFGRRAFVRLQTVFPPANLTLVDSEPAAVQGIQAAGGRAVTMDAIRFLVASHARMAPDDWIVPAVPIHVAYEWLHHQPDLDMAVEALTVPRELDDMLPNSFRGPEGQLYVSNADFLCPDDCPEPEGLCTVTGEPRPRVLHETLSRLVLPGFQSICIVSEQLAPGVGGYRLRALDAALETVLNNTGSFLVSTACKCHGVVHALRKAE
ncbi:MAG: hypothetical protein LJE94_05570 [Deltaproteobacteria bacterium]|nr:hypothetical protein [Deltaproteobacteria bacterium]